MLIWSFPRAHTLWQILDSDLLEVLKALDLRN